MSSKPHIWIVGAGRVSLRIPLLRQLRDSGFQVAAAGPVHSDEFAANGIPFHGYSLTRRINPWADRRSIHELAELFGRHRPDLVHAVNTKPSLFVPRAAQRAGVPACVRTITGLGAIFSSRSTVSLLLRPVYRFLQGRAAAQSDFTIFQNPDDRDYFLSHRLIDADRQSLVHGSGIDVEAFRAGVSEETTLAALRRQLGVERRPVVSMVARLLKPKGIEQFLQAAARVRRKIPNAAFVLIGPAVCGGPTAIPVDGVASSPDVIYLGRREDIADLLAISDLFVLPSYLREGLPRVLLEASALGLPLITTDMPGCRDVVVDGWNGYLVPPRDDKTLAAAIVDLLSNPAQRAAMGERSLSHVTERFHLRLVAEAYAGVYRHVLGEPSARQMVSRRQAA